MKLIYVPQGKYAQLANTLLADETIGLYTNRFSTCNIVAVIGDNKRILMHADTALETDRLLQMLTWIEKPLQIVVLYRAEHAHIITETLVRILENHYPGSVQKYAVDESIDGVELLLTPQEKRPPHEFIRLTQYKAALSGVIIRHPHEQILETLTKLKQVIGVPARFEKVKTFENLFCIFDGFFWTHPLPSDLDLDLSHPSTQEQMTLLRQGQDFYTIMDALKIIIDKIKAKYPVQYVVDTCSSAADIAFYAENYLQGYNADKIFKINVQSLLDSMSSDDRGFRRSVEILMQSSDCTVDKILSAFQSFFLQRNTPNYVAMQNQLDYIHSHYIRRQNYHDVSVLYQSMKKEAIKTTSEAVKQLKTNPTQKTRSLFLKAIMIHGLCSSRTDPDLLIALWNCARTDQRMGFFQPAQRIYSIALSIYQDDCEKSAHNQEKIVKIETAIAECERALRT